MNSKMRVCTRKHGVGVKTGYGRENQNMYAKMCANGREKTLMYVQKTWKLRKPRYGRDNCGVYVKAPCGNMRVLKQQRPILGRKSAHRNVQMENWQTM